MDARTSYLVVRLAERVVALPVEQVVEICRVLAFEAGQGEAAGLLGLTMLRGAPTAVLDLCALLGWAEADSGRERTTTARLVTVRMQAASASGRAAVLAANAAFLVDEVIGVREIADSAIESIALPGDRTQQIGGFDQGFARLIDASGLISEQAWQQIAEAAR